MTAIKTSRNKDISIIVVLLIVGLLLYSISPVVFLLSIVLILLGYSYSNNQWLLFILSLAYLSRLLIIVADAQLGVLPQPSIAPIHHANAKTLAASWGNLDISNTLSGVGPLRRFVAYLFAPFYVTFGPGQIAGQIGAATFGVSLGLVVFRISMNFMNQSRSLFSTLLVMFWPSLFYRSIVMQREIIIVFLMMLSLFFLLRLSEDMSPHLMIGLVGASIVIGYLRPENLVIIACTFFMVVTIVAMRLTYLKAIISLSVIVCLFTIVIFTSISHVDVLIGRHGSTLTVETIDSFARGRAHGGSVYLSHLQYNSWTDIVLALPMKIVYFLYSPMPWQIQNAVQLFAGFSGWALFFASIKSVQGTTGIDARKGKLSVLLTFLVIGVLGYAIIEFNAGAAFRRRILFVPIIIMLATSALPRFKIRW